MEKSDMPRRYVAAWRDVVDDEKGASRAREGIVAGRQKDGIVVLK